MRELSRREFLAAGALAVPFLSGRAESAPPSLKDACQGLFLIGTGREPWAMPDELRARFRQHNITVETARTGSAISTYNILLGEGRRVAAGLIAVE